MRKWLVVGVGIVAAAIAIIVIRTLKDDSIQATRAGPAAVPTVRTAVLEEETLAVTVESVGTVHANEAIEITAQITALLSRVPVREGAHVAKGVVLAELDSAQARAALAEAEAALINSTGIYRRSLKLGSSAAVSEAQLEQLQADVRRDEARVAAARARLDDTVIRAPFSGVVGLRRVSPGGLVTPGAVITTLDDLSTVKVDFAVPETTLPALRPGLAVTATSSVYPERVFAGRVDSVDPRVDPSTRAVRVRARFPNEDALLTPGMFVTVALTHGHQTTVVAPEGALIPERGKQYVYVVDDDKALRREVTVGRRVPGRVQILEGLAAGERVVVDGALKVRDGAPVADVANPTTDIPGPRT